MYAIVSIIPVGLCCSLLVSVGLCRVGLVVQGSFLLQVCWLVLLSHICSMYFSVLIFAGLYSADFPFFVDFVFYEFAVAGHSTMHVL